jgi:hypothetical protein
MANINNAMYISGNVCQHGIYTFVSTSYTAGNNYIHFKTNCLGASYMMTKIEALGHNYAANANVRCAWSWYTYTYLTSTGANSIYSGLTAENGIYLSSDNYVCFRGYTASPGDICFTLNVTQANPVGSSVVSILAASKNSTSGNYY